MSWRPSITGKPVDILPSPPKSASDGGTIANPYLTKDFPACTTPLRA
ncbi:hypothetical protein ASAP_1157 [Asaia bogorensis]|uniref:Uncharacterized protein n=1 Tax=Asaia bogorensis TaxID=91915 RepID=A0A060QK42_9PROT|nr:hypothetical protein ASAP_1157 [Asaia bogorensis]